MLVNFQPTVSIIMPVFNGARFIREAIESALNQTFKDLEIIVIDDGSTDDTKILLEDWIKEGKIRYLYQENRGLAAARNTGINLAQGRYIKFLDCDDFLYPDQIKLQVEQLQGADKLISISDSCFLRPNGKVVACEYYPADEERQLASFFEYNPAPVHAYLTPKAMIQEVGGFDESFKACEDWDLWIRLLQEGAVIVHLPYMGCCYRISLTSMSADAQKMLLQKCKVAEKVNSWLLKEENLSQQLNKWYWYEAASKANDRLLEECIAREVPLESNLKNTLQLFSMDFQSRLRGKSRERYDSLGIEQYLKMEHFRHARMDKTYRRNLLNKDSNWKLGDSREGKGPSHNGKSTPHFVFFRRFNPDADWGGTEVVMMNWFSKIDFERCKVTMVVPKGSKQIFASRIQANAWPINVLEFEFFYVRPARQKIRELLPFISGLKPMTIIYVMGWYIDFDYAEVFAGFLGTKGRIYMHENVGPADPPPKPNKKFFGFIPSPSLWWHMSIFLVSLKGYLSRKVLFVSKDVRERYIQAWRYPRHNTLVMHHGTEPSRFSPSQKTRAALRYKYNLNESDIVIIATARLAEFKRLNRLIDAFDKASKDFDNLRLFLAGIGPLEQDLKALATSKASRDHITFLGYVDNVRDLLRMSDIYVLSSDNEGLSLALLESMASGLICISTKCPGSGEAIEDGVNGFLVEKSSEGVYEGLMKALNLSAEERHKIRQRARQTVVDRFDVNNNIKKVFRLFGVPYKD